MEIGSIFPTLGLNGVLWLYSVFTGSTKNGDEADEKFVEDVVVDVEVLPPLGQLCWRHFFSVLWLKGVAREQVDSLPSSKAESAVSLEAMDRASASTVEVLGKDDDDRGVDEAVDDSGGGTVKEEGLEAEKKLESMQM